MNKDINRVNEFMTKLQALMDEYKVDEIELGGEQYYRQIEVDFAGIYDDNHKQISPWMSVSLGSFFDTNSTITEKDITS